MLEVRVRVARRERVWVESRIQNGATHAALQYCSTAVCLFSLLLLNDLCVPEQYMDD